MLCCLTVRGDNAVNIRIILRLTKLHPKENYKIWIDEVL